VRVVEVGVGIDEVVEVGEVGVVVGIDVEVSKVGEVGVGIDEVV
jgi:hypothetical protein